MPKQVAVISPKCCHHSAERLASLIGATYLPAERFDYTDFDVVINYGSSTGGQFKKVINRPEAVKICVNKISTLKRVVNGVEWTKDVDVAKDWLKKDGAVVARATETGSRSDGTMIAMNLEGFKECPAKFWTRYFDHVHEVRVNVYKGKILSVYEKLTDEKDEFYFQYMNVEGAHHQVDAMIDSISKNIGIDLYGMDVLVNKKGEARLLEINSGAVLLEETEPALLQLLEKDLA